MTTILWIKHHWSWNEGNQFQGKFEFKTLQHSILFSHLIKLTGKYSWSWNCSISICPSPRHVELDNSINEMSNFLHNQSPPWYWKSQDGLATGCRLGGWKVFILRVKNHNSIGILTIWSLWMFWEKLSLSDYFFELKNIGINMQISGSTC